MSKLPIFITGNQSKADYLSRQLGIQLSYKKVDLDEIQSTDLHKIVEHKLKQAYMEFFDSELPGTIAEHPVGENGFGFDQFFINDGYTITRAQMTQEENERTYATMMKPFAKVRDYLESID